MSSQIQVEENEDLTGHNNNSSFNSSSGSVFQPWNEDGSQIVLVLVGLTASGKSTFAQALETHIPYFRRCNQDSLGKRNRVERLARKCLDEGLSVCIDRTNFDHDQRRHWIEMAHDYPRCKLWCIIFDTPIWICKERLLHRSGHPTIRTPEEGISVLNRFQQMLVLPDAPVAPTTTIFPDLGFRSRDGVTEIRGGDGGGGGEGFERIFRLNYESYPSPNYTPEDIHDILTRVSNAIPIIPIQNPDPMAILNASPNPNPNSDAYGYRYGYAYATDRNSNTQIQTQNQPRYQPRQRHLNEYFAYGPSNKARNGNRNDSYYGHNFNNRRFSNNDNNDNYSIDDNNNNYDINRNKGDYRDYRDNREGYRGRFIRGNRSIGRGYGRGNPAFRPNRFTYGNSNNGGGSDSGSFGGNVSISGFDGNGRNIRIGNGTGSFEGGRGGGFSSNNNNNESRNGASTSNSNGNT